MRKVSINITTLNKRDYADILTFVLSEAYSCHKRMKITELHLEQNYDVKIASRLVSSENAMKKYIKLGKKIAEALNITSIDWDDPSKFNVYIF